MTADSIEIWLEKNYSEKIHNLQKEQKEILTAKEIELRNELLTKSNDYRTVKFGNIVNENKISINNLLQKFRYNKDLLIEKNISEVVKLAKDSLKEMIETEESFKIYYYSNLINFVILNFPGVVNIYCPVQIEQFFSKLKIETDTISLLTTEDIEMGVIAELEPDKKLVYFTSEIMYENNKEEIRKVIYQILMEND